MTHGQDSLPAVCPSMSQQSQQNCTFAAMNDFAAAAAAALAAAAAAALHFTHRLKMTLHHQLTMTLTASCKACN